MRGVAIPGDLVPVAVETLRPKAVLQFDLFLRGDSGQVPVLFRECHYPLEAGDLTSLAERGVETLYIAAHEMAAYERYLRERVIP